MSHREIWDDSALVDSWNEALEEYKQYHSISARGEKVEDVLKKAENQSNGIGGEMGYEDEEALDQQGYDAHAKKYLPKDPSDHDRMSQGVKSRVEGEQGDATIETSRRATSKVSEIPSHLIGQVQDEGLKNLLMAWYYAGYYTGLTEGKQQGKDEPTNKRHAKHEA